MRPLMIVGPTSLQVRAFATLESWSTDWADASPGTSNAIAIEVAVSRNRMETPGKRPTATVPVILVCRGSTRTGQRVARRSAPSTDNWRLAYGYPRRSETSAPTAVTTWPSRNSSRSSWQIASRFRSKQTPLSR